MEMLLYVIPLVISLVGFSIWTAMKIKRDVMYDHCVTFGTLLFALMGMAVSVLPLVNIIGVIVVLFSAALKWEYEIKDFFDRPICFWRD